MKILKKGNIAMKFICTNCDTIFEANKEECRVVVHTSLQDVSFDNYDYKVACPCCGKIVYHIINQ